MRWEDERWIKIYTRDTAEWLALGWEAQALFLLLLRKSDRAGLIHSGRARVRGLAALVAMPLEIVERALPILLEDGCVRETDRGHLIPNFLAAQEASTSPSQRKRDQRERDRDQALADGFNPATSGMAIESLAVTKRDEQTVARHASTSRQKVTHVVTPEGHAGTVTPRVEESRRDKSREDLFSAVASAPAAPAKKAKEAKKPPQPNGDPRHAPLVKALVETCGYPFRDGRDAKAVTALLALADQQEATRGDTAGVEIVRRARIGWAWTGHDSKLARSITDLVNNWGHYATEYRAVATGPPDVRRGSVRAELIDHTKQEEPF